MMAVARIETLRLVRDRVAISLIAVVPAVQIVLFGYAVNLDPKDVPIAIAGSDGPSVERAARVVGETGYFKIIGEGLPSGAAERMAAAGRALVGIELPPSPAMRDLAMRRPDHGSSLMRPIPALCVRRWPRRSRPVGEHARQHFRWMTAPLSTSIGSIIRRDVPLGRSSRDWSALLS
jgi:hypothetical protein